MFASSFKNSYSPSNQTTPKSKRKATRVQWACFNCRKRKQGCDSVRPCKRCVEKGIPCVEVESKRRRGRTKKEDLNKLASSSKPSSVSKVHHHHTLRGSNGASAMDISVSAESSQISQSDSSSSSEEDNDNSSCFEDDETEMCHNQSTPKAHKVVESAEDNSTSSPQMEDFKAKCSNEIVNQGVPNNNSPLMESVSLISSTSLINSEVYSAVNLGLLSPLLENFALSCNMFLSNFQEGNTMNNSFSSFPLVDDMCGSSDPNYEFLGSLNQSDWQCLDAFSSVPISSNPEQCSIDFCYKLLSKRLTNNEGAQKLHLRIKFLWKEILLALRNLDWKKAQLMIEEMNSSPPLILLSDYVFRQSPSVVMWSPGGRIHFANEAFCVLSGYNIDELRASSNQLSTMGFNHSESNKVNANQLFDSSEIGKILSKQLEAIQGSRSSASSFLMKTKLLSKSKREIPINCSLNHLKDSFGFLILTTMIILP